MADLNSNQLFEIFERTFRANPRNYANYTQRQGGEGYENDVFYDMVHGSPAVSGVRQALPNNLGETRFGQWLQHRLPASAQGVVDRVPLGGMTQLERIAYSRARASDPELQRYTSELGKLPVGLGEIPTDGNWKGAAAQAAGVAAADLATDGFRNIWWFLNAPQAVASIAVLNAIHRAGSDYLPNPNVPLLKNRNTRLAATLPAVIGMSMAIGNAYRHPGYKAALPSDEDAKTTSDLIGELGARYVLGRGGSLLPYKQFAEERPDVSKREYDAYKNYLFGNPSPLKATLDGVQGPEVTFVGKSIPLLTGIIPTVAAIAGARYGVRKAASRLAKQGLLDEAVALRNEAKAAKFYEARGQKAYEAAYPDEPLPRARYSELFSEYDTLQRVNEGAALKSSLLYSGGGLTAAALAGHTLESIRRSMKGAYGVEEEKKNMTLPSNAINFA